MNSMTRRLKALGVLLALALVASGCAAAQAFRQGDSAMRAGNLDEARSSLEAALLPRRRPQQPVRS